MTRVNMTLPEIAQQYDPARLVAPSRQFEDPVWLAVEHHDGWSLGLMFGSDLSIGVCTSRERGTTRTFRTLDALFSALRSAMGVHHIGNVRLAFNEFAVEETE